MYSCACYVRARPRVNFVGVSPVPRGRVSWVTCTGLGSLRCSKARTCQPPYALAACHGTCNYKRHISGWQTGCVRAAQAVKAFVEKARKDLGLDVYAYSVFHIFFEQYGSIRSQAAVLLGAAMCAVAVIVLLFTGSAWASALILAVLLLIEVAPLSLPEWA